MEWFDLVRRCQEGYASDLEWYAFALGIKYPERIHEIMGDLADCR